MLENYWKYIDGNEKIMKDFFIAVIKAVKNMEEIDKHAYYVSYFTIHESIFGKHFNEEMAKYAVSKMVNVDGTKGEHWTLQQINTVVTSNNLSYNKYDLYYVMNMLYSDFSEVVGTDANIYLKMAKAYIDDPDASEDKAYCMWKAKYFM